MRSLLLLTLLTFSFSARASSEWSLSGSLDTSDRQTSNSLTASDSMTLESSWDQDLNFTYGTSKTKATATSQTLSTKGFTGDADWTTPANFDFDISLQYSVDTTDQVQSLQPGISIGQKFFLKFEDEVAEKSQRSFEPYVKIDLGLARNTVTPESSNQRLVNRMSLVQSSSNATLKLKPLQWLSLRASYTKYNYNRDLESFSQALGTRRVTNQIGNGFSDSIASFLEYKWSVSSTFYIEDFALTLKRSFTKDATTPTTSLDTIAEIDWTATKTWDVSVGIGSLTETDQPGATAHYLAGVTANF